MPAAAEAVMIFAAGFGTRMGGLTATRPKPLLTLAGQTLIDRALAQADAAGVARKVVNLHYRGDQIRTHLGHRRDVTFSPEETILETGGGLLRAWPLLASDPVFTLNSDILWDRENPLTCLDAAWDGARMDALVLLVPRCAVPEFDGPGDFDLDPQGRIRRGRDYIYCGAQIICRRALDGIAQAAFSLNLAWDRTIEAERLFGAIYPGRWRDIGSAAGLARAEAALAAQGGRDDV